jgi:hypothetical protein
MNTDKKALIDQLCDDILRRAWERAALLSSAPWLAREHAAQEFKRLLDALHALTQFAPQQRNRLQARLDERLDQQLQQLGSESARPC